MSESADVEVIDWLTPAQAAKYLQVSERWLQRHRTGGTGPRFARSGQVVRYRREDLDTWMRQEVTPRSEVWVPFSVRREVAEAIEVATPGETTLQFARALAAIDALKPWMQELLDSPERFVTQPLAHCDRLEDNRACR